MASWNPIARWIDRLPGDSPARGLHFPLIHLICSTMDYGDKDFGVDMAHGVPISGTVPAKDVRTKRYRPDVATMEQWRASVPIRNKRNLERVQKTQGSPAALACWEKTLAEVAEGWVTMPVPLSNAMLNTTVLTPRYATTESHGGRPAKVRLIDDFRASGVNDVLTTHDANVPGNLDVFHAGLPT